MNQLFSAQALSGVFLAEQIRQQQLASELQNHLQNSNSSLAAMQALLSLGGTPANGAGGGETKRKQVLQICSLNISNISIRQWKNQYRCLETERALKDIN